MFLLCMLHVGVNQFTHEIKHGSVMVVGQSKGNYIESIPSYIEGRIALEIEQEEGQFHVDTLQSCFPAPPLARCYTRVLPQDKATLIHRLKTEKPIAFVGDGII